MDELNAYRLSMIHQSFDSNQTKTQAAKVNTESSPTSSVES
jgi:hypothetical protein